MPSSRIQQCLAWSLLFFSLAPPATPANAAADALERTNLSSNNNNERRLRLRSARGAAEEFREATQRALQFHHDDEAEQRHLGKRSEPGDWKNMNDLLKDAVFELPDTDIQEMVVFQTFQASLKNMVCGRVSFEDIKITPDLRSDTEANLAYQLVKLKIDCELDYKWKYIFVSGNGHADVKVKDSSAMGAIDVFSQEGFSQSPPDSGTFTACQTDIQIEGIDFSGNIASEIMNLFEGLIVDVLNELLNDVICGSLVESGDTSLSGGLGALTELLNPYLEPVEEWRYNVTYPEDSMEIDENATLFSWSDQSSFAEFVAAAMDEMETFLGSLEADENAPLRTATLPNGTQIPPGYDLGINTLLREYLLDDDRSLFVNGSDLADNASSFIITGWHDDFLECNLSVVELRVYGLDTFTFMQPFQRIQNFTLQNSLSWESLSFDLVLRGEFLASSKETSVLRDSVRTDPYEEEVRISVGVDDIQTVISIMIALEPDAYFDVQLGALLNSISAVPCGLANLYNFSVAGLNVTLGDIRMPTVEGLVSPGFDRLLKDGMDLFFFMYKATIVKAIPAIFQSDVRDLIRDALNGTACESFDLSGEDEFIDLRDLMLSEEEAKELGATGEAPYGDLTSNIYGIAKGMWEEVEEDGTLALNSMFINPIFEATSGVEGRFYLEKDLFYFITAEGVGERTNKTGGVEDLVNRFECKIYDLTLNNLNTIVDPMAIVQPINHPYITQSTIKIGPVENAPINASIIVAMSLDIEDTPLKMENIVSLGFSLASMELFAELQTMVSRNHLLNFRIGDGDNAGCIFGVIESPELNETGYRIEPRIDRGVEIRRLLAKISDLQLHIDCIQCSPGLDSLPGLVDIFDRSQITDILSYRVPLFLEEISISDKMQIHLDRWLYSAPFACPHRPEYNETWQNPSTWIYPEFKQLSVEASDTMFFVALAGFEVAFVLAVETHYPWELNTLQPLSGQERFVPPAGSDILDFIELFGENNTASSIRSYLSDVRVDKQTNEEELGVNLFVRDWFAPDDEGKIDIVALLGGEPLDFVIEGVVFLVHSLKIRGLDTFTRFDAFKPISPQTILNSFHLRHLAVEVNMTAGSRHSPEQYVSISWGMKDLNATVPIFAAIDLNKLTTLELGHFLNTSNAFSCFLASMVDFHLPQALLTVGEISPLTFQGFLPDSSEALRQSMEEVFERYGERALKALPIMFDVTTRTFLNTWFASGIGENANCTHIKDIVATESPKFGVGPYPYNRYLDFRELLLKAENSTAMGGAGRSLYGDLFRTVVNPIQNELLWVDPGTGLSSANGFLGPVGEFVSGEPGTIVIPQFSEPNIPNFDVKFGALIAALTFGFGDVRIENIDTLGDPLALLNPIFMKPLMVENSAGLGVGRPFKVSFRVILNVTSYDPPPGEYLGNLSELVPQGSIINDVRMGLALEDAVALFNLFTRIHEDKLIHFPMVDISNPYCWASLFQAPNLDEYGVRLEDEISTFVLSDIVLSVSKLNLTLECIACETRGMKDFIAALSSPEASESMTDVANSVLELLPDILSGNLIADQLDRFFNASFPRYCPHHPDYVPGANFSTDDVKFPPMDFTRNVPPKPLVFLVAGILGSLVCLSFVTTVVVRWTVNRRHQQRLRRLPVQKILIIQHLQQADDQLEQELNDTTAPMISAEEIPKWIRYAMPCIVFVNMAMFFSGHITIAADVAMEFRIVGEAVPFERFYSFAIINATIDMWVAGAHVLSVLMLTFSGIWPYVKQLTTLVCWVAPTRYLSISTRGKIYLWLDALAKWSILDIFVVLLYFVSFRLDGTLPDYPFLPKDFLGLTFYIVPKWGLYANLIAQIISQISSHFIIHYHRMIVLRATKDYEARHIPPRKPDNTTNESSSDGDRRSSLSSRDEQGRLCDGSFARPHKGESSRLVARQIASYGLVACTITLCIFIIVGNFFPSTSIEVQGLMSYLKGEDTLVSFSVMDIAALLFKDGVRLGGFSNVAGHILLALLLIVTVLLVPVIQAIALAFQWFKPLNDKQRHRLSNAIEILGAWQFLDVFILATIISAWQQGQTSEMVMKNQCADFDVVFDMAAYYGILEKERAHCLRVEAELLSGIYILFSGAFLLAVLKSFVGKATFHYFWDKECIRKEEAVEHLLTPEQEAKEMCPKTLKTLRPPPILFTDSFRWLLRTEHLGDRPLSWKQPVQEVVLGQQFEGLNVQVDHIVDEKLSVSSESQSWPDEYAAVDVDKMTPRTAASSTVIEC